MSVDVAMACVDQETGKHGQIKKQPMCALGVNLSIKQSTRTRWGVMVSCFSSQYARKGVTSVSHCTVSAHKSLSDGEILRKNYHSALF